MLSVVINYFYKLATSCSNQCCFHETQTSTFMLSLLLPLLCAANPLCVDCGGWLFVFFSQIPRWWSAEKNCFWNFNPNWQNEVLSKLSALLYLRLAILRQIYLYNWQKYPYCLRFNPNQFSNPENGGCNILRNVGTFNHSTVQKPRRRPWSD